MDTTNLELELLDLEALHKRTKNSATRAELADKIALKKREIKKAKEVEKEKKFVPQADAPARMDHAKEVKANLITTGENSFSFKI